ncbi:MAG: monovalent cation/H+ antiporter subunit D family protein [Bacteroidetes bacterium]|nr:monovalent cation/H+ antiporter subunit D family protein [Bacteroidota bacterium]MBK9516435.1 monovalent cation/H+ antiporter subunit D family protein [Anaeromyxobacter sp.]MBL0275666.1 monovalent cation/H+ antiporter subunit D family protein [Anaeromyxobacter sp.]
MTLDAALPVLILLTSAVPGLAIFFLGEERHLARATLNLAGAMAKVALLGLVLWGVFHGHAYETRLPFLPGIDFVLRVDAPALLFGALSGVLWLLTTVYAIAYLEHSPHRSRFFGFFSLCVTASMGVALAGNLVTFLVFYEFLTLTTWPLVVHRGTPQALAGGRVYLAYTLGGSALLLAGIAWLHAVAGPVEFTERGALAAVAGRAPELRAIFALLAAGLGVKAALVPLHGWLPRAMVAPAPVSALLHAVAVVKAGAFGLVRLVYDVFGIEFGEQLGVLAPLAVVAAVTIVWGSLRAVFQDDLKKRLAYSTVSQVSYIVLGTAVVGELSTVGGLVHLVHQGLMKITLFFCAGNLAETLGVHKVSEMGGAGRRMPLTMAAFTVGALGMMGLPPLAGFVSKWYLGVGALQAGQGWVIWVLAASTLLNAAYFLPILRAAWFEPAPAAWPHEETFRHETALGLLVPPLVTALLVIAAGLFAGSDFSPLAWAKLIVAREYAH